MAQKLSLRHKQTMSEKKEFYLVALPGLEDLVLQELRDWHPELEANAQHGGVLLRAPLEVGLALNLCLKTPTRILLRVDSFVCKDFPKLFKKMAELPWNEWVKPNCKLTVRAATARSRLKIKKRIEETCLEGWKASQKGIKGSKMPEGQLDLYVRIVDNVCTLSLDTSGERLHKRGLRTHIGAAPLRETIAAGLLQMLESSTENRDPVTLVDPMIGSGTFLLEANLRDQLVDQRDFAFDSFKSSEIGSPDLKVARAKFSNFFGFESEKKTLKAARENLKSINANLNLIETDFFKVTKPITKAANHQTWVINNPPYGERLKIEKPLGEYYAELFRQTEHIIRPDRACFLLPAKALKGRLQLPLQWKVLEKRKFLNGGIPVTAFVFGRKA